MNPTDAFFGRMVVQKGFATDDEVQSCLAESAARAGRGQPIAIGPLMVERGVLTPEQVKSIAVSQNKRVLACPACSVTFTVLGLPPGKTMPCKHCGAPLVDKEAEGAAPAPLTSQPGLAAMFDMPSLPGIAQPAPNAESPTLVPRGPARPASGAHPAGARPAGPNTATAPHPPTGPTAPTLLSAAGSQAPAASFARTDPLIGRTFADKYVIKRKLGQGGMGAVYLAQQTNLGRQVAIKILPQNLAADETLVKRFRLEAQATASLDAPNIVGIFDIGDADGYHYIAMEFVEGQPVDALIKSHGRIGWKQAVDITRQAALGLGVAHAKGVIHRDIKPANLMMSNTRVIKVMDFGLARLAKTDSHLSQTGQILGTPHFMSPEQARGEATDQRTDIYSLGASLYYMVTGSTPFDAPVPTMLLLKVLDEEPAPITEAVPAAPPALQAVIARMMAKDPANRYPDTAALVRDLEGVLAGQAIAAPPPRAPTAPRRSPSSPNNVPAPVSARPKPSIAIAGAAGGALVIAIAAFALSGGGDAARAAEELEATRKLVTDVSQPAAERLRYCEEYLKRNPGADAALVSEVTAWRNDLLAVQVAEGEILLVRKNVQELLSAERYADAEQAVAASRKQHAGAKFAAMAPRFDELDRQIADAKKAAATPAPDPNPTTGLPIDHLRSMVDGLIGRREFEQARRNLDEAYQRALPPGKRVISTLIKVVEDRQKEAIAVERKTLEAALARRDVPGARTSISLLRQMGDTPQAIEAAERRAADLDRGGGSGPVDAMQLEGELRRVESLVRDRHMLDAFESLDRLTTRADPTQVARVNERREWARGEQRRYIHEATAQLDGALRAGRVDEAKTHLDTIVGLGASRDELAALEVRLADAGSGRAPRDPPPGSPFERWRFELDGAVRALDANQTLAGIRAYKDLADKPKAGSNEERDLEDALIRAGAVLAATGHDLELGQLFAPIATANPRLGYVALLGAYGHLTAVDGSADAAKRGVIAAFNLGIPLTDEVLIAAGVFEQFDVLETDHGYHAALSVSKTAGRYRLVTPLCPQDRQEFGEAEVHRHIRGKNNAENTVGPRVKTMIDNPSRRTRAEVYSLWRYVELRASVAKAEPARDDRPGSGSGGTGTRPPGGTGKPPGGKQPGGGSGPGGGGSGPGGGGSGPGGGGSGPGGGGSGAPRPGPGESMWDIFRRPLVDMWGEYERERPHIGPWHHLALVLVHTGAVDSDAKTPGADQMRRWTEMLASGKAPGWEGWVEQVLKALAEAPDK